MPKTPIRAGMRSNASVTFGVTPDALMDVWMRQLNEHGCRSFWVYDVLFNIDKMHRPGQGRQGSTVRRLPGRSCSLRARCTPTTTTPTRADQLSACPDIDTLLLYDTAGVLERERMKTLVPAIVAKARGKPVEFHSNNILGMSAKAYCDIVEFGVTILHTATRPHGKRSPPSPPRKS